MNENMNENNNKNYNKNDNDNEYIVVYSTLQCDNWEVEYAWMEDDLSGAWNRARTEIIKNGISNYETYEICQTKGNFEWKFTINYNTPIEEKLPIELKYFP